MCTGKPSKIAPTMVLFIELCRASSKVHWGGPCLQEGESLQYAPVSVRHLLVHDLIQHGDTHAQQYERLLWRMAVCMQALI